jgi:MerR family transcriptional regulator/heat shock protein HspR
VHYVKITEIRAELGVDETFIETLASEELIVVKHSVEGEGLLSEADASRLCMIVRLMRDLDVNLAGVEVILHMRDEVFSMQHQFDEVMHSLVGELRKRFSER